VLISRGSESIILVATAASTIFITVGGSALAFLFVQKKTEVSTEAKELDKIMINK
jgi:flagellar motor component MotA